MKTDFYLTLLTEVKEFEESEFCKPNSDVEDFRKWMNYKKYEEESPTKLFINEEHEVSFLENEICKQILLLARYSKQLIRKSLSEFPEIANEEFTYLYRLKDEPFLTKIQLTEKNGHEKQTGMQILKRLLDYGLIEEQTDDEDRRIKKLNLSEKGENLFHDSVPSVNKTSKILSGKLTEEEKKKLFEILLKLNEYHSHINANLKTMHF